MKPLFLTHKIRVSTTFASQNLYVPDRQAEHFIFYLLFRYLLYSMTVLEQCNLHTPHLKFRHIVGLVRF